MAFQLMRLFDASIARLPLGGLSCLRYTPIFFGVFFEDLGCLHRLHEMPPMPLFLPLSIFSSFMGTF